MTWRSHIRELTGLLLLGLLSSLPATSAAQAPPTPTRGRTTLTELSIGLGAYFLQTDQTFYPDDSEDVISHARNSGFTYGFHTGLLLGWRVHPQLRFGFALELGVTGPGATEASTYAEESGIFLLAGPALRYARDERRGFVLQGRPLVGMLFPVGWAVGGGLAAGYAFALGGASAVTVGADLRVIRARLDDDPSDSGEYDDATWMISPSGLVSFVL